MASKKRAKNKTSNYIVSMDRKVMDKESASYIGKVRSNFVGTEFIAYDNGLNPSDSNASADANGVSSSSSASSSLSSPSASSSSRSSTTSNSITDTLIRQELMAALYEPNILGAKGPRKMTILLPNLQSSAVFRPRSESESMLSLYRKEGSTLLMNATATVSSSSSSSSSSRNSGPVMILQNKAPRWNEQIGAHVLNFHGRVTQASVKNFQLIDAALAAVNAQARGVMYPPSSQPSPAQVDEPILLQFGRVAKHVFTMDVQHPLSLFQAFSICLSSFDGKLACE